MKNLNETKITGVTFNNEDGESRQEILKSLPRYVELKLVKTTYNGQFAVKVIELKTNKLIGWIPKSNLDSDIVNCQRLTGIVEKTKDTYHVTARRQDVPSGSQYRLISMLCRKFNLEKPVYDKITYGKFLADVRKKGLIA